MLPLLSIVLLCACTAALPNSEQIRTQYSEMTAANATVKILSDIEVSALEYQAEYQYNKLGEDHLILTAPDEIAGIEIYISGERSDELTLRYAGTELFLALDSPSGTRPVDAVSALMQTLQTEEPTAIGTDLLDGMEALHLTYREADSDPEIMRDVWLDANGLPLYAEIFLDGRKCVTLSFTDFSPQA